MGGQGVGFKQSSEYHLHNLNPKVGPEAGNAPVMAQALAYLPLAGNSPVPEGEASVIPENHLDVGEVHGGMEGAFKTKVE